MNEIEKAEIIHLANIEASDKKIARAYYKAISKIFANQKMPKPIRRNFTIAQVPNFKLAIDRALNDLNRELLNITMAGITASWKLSNKKILAFIVKNLPYDRFSPQAKLLISNPNISALEAFKTRKTAGLKISDRVWKNTKQFRINIEKVLADGIVRGESVNQVAKNLRQYLNEPDKSFRRIRDKNGKLVISNNAKNYHPGQGVYRSSMANAKRLAKNEINTAYRVADIKKYQAIPFIIGYQIKLAWNHPQFDICDKLIGKYPKTFIFRGWHILCLCFSVPIFAKTDEIDKWIRYGNTKFSGEITTVPNQVNRWVRDNSEELEKWKRLPHWITENKIKIG